MTLIDTFHRDIVEASQGGRVAELFFSICISVEGSALDAPLCEVVDSPHTNRYASSTIEEAQHGTLVGRIC